MSFWKASIATFFLSGYFFVTLLSQQSSEADALGATFMSLDSRENLYDIDAKFALQAFFDRDHLRGVRVVPKYFFRGTHPQWTEPDDIISMQFPEYERLLDRVQQVKSLGELQRAGAIGVTMNLRTTFMDEYEGGFVKRELFRHSPNEPHGVASFAVMFFVQISGRIESKKILEFRGMDQRYEIQVSGKRYLTTEKEFRRLVVGREYRVRAAGPISDF